MFLLERKHWLTKEEECRRDIGLIKCALRIDERYADPALRFNSESASSESELINAVGRFCKECLSLTGAHGALSIQSVDGIDKVIDPWGNPYNIGLLNTVSHAWPNQLKDSAIGSVLVWSSGPNGINENGGGDDIVEQPSTTLRQKGEE